VKSETPRSSRDTSTPIPSKEEEEEDEDIKPPKKKRKRAKELDDAKLAAMLQAQENSRARSTRAGVNKKGSAAKKKTLRKKSEKKVKADDDSDLELGSDGEVKEKVRKGGFHVSICIYALSHVTFDDIL